MSVQLAYSLSDAFRCCKIVITKGCGDQVDVYVYAVLTLSLEAVDLVGGNDSKFGGFETMTLTTSPIAVEKSFSVFDFAISAKRRRQITSMTLSTL
mmetsp:Transcript_14976/g.41704  ORF Transcript_14976/g.41704 Transcript_14976/m.41704 type:complete len:96 (-) Transcript_14976:1640-1927(-)